MGFRIFAHAMRLVFGHLGPALRISGILYLLTSGAGIVLTYGVGSDPTPQRIGLGIVALALELVGAIWIAIAWHRYVLLDEEPESILPAFNGRRILAYFGYSLLVSLALAGLGLVVVIILGLLSLSPRTFFVTIPVGIFLVLVASVVGSRLSLVLPASSIGRPMSLRDAWGFTQHASWPIFWTTLLTFVFLLLISVPSLVFQFSRLSVPAEIWSVIVNWIALMIGVAIITTIYGHYVEGRDIP